MKCIACTSKLPQERLERGKRVGFDCMWLRDEMQRAPLASAEGPVTGHMVGHLEEVLGEYPVKIQ